MFQRLCGDHTGTPYDGGRLHSIQLRGFLRLLEIAADKSLLVFDEAASDLIHSTDYKAALRTQRNGLLRTDTTPTITWFYVMLSDKRDTRDIIWSLSAINVRTRTAFYYSIQDEQCDVSLRDNNHITAILESYDELYTSPPFPPWSRHSSHAGYGYASWHSRSSMDTRTHSVIGRRLRMPGATLLHAYYNNLYRFSRIS